MAKNLYNLTEVTTVNNSDLLHVNQGSVSSDRKVTKQNLLKEVNSSINSLNSSLAKKVKYAGISWGNTFTTSEYVNTGILIVKTCAFAVWVAGSNDISIRQLGPQGFSLSSSTGSVTFSDDSATGTAYTLTRNSDHTVTFTKNTSGSVGVQMFYV